MYTPKDDPYLRAEWRKRYPADELGRLGELVRRAQANHVEFGYVLSPGLSVCYSKPSEAGALAAKFESMWKLGVRSFVVAFDDIDYQRWNCDEDRTEFGTGPSAAARWSSPWSDDQWLQVRLAEPQRVGMVTLRWEAAHASAYEIRTSPDGEHWTTAATVTDSHGGTESVRLDAPGARFVRMQGLGRASGFGYSVYEFEVHPVAESGS